MAPRPPPDPCGVGASLVSTTNYPADMDPRDRRTASSYEDVIANQAQNVAIQPGTSGYFSRPEADLDPRIFDGKFVKPQVRRWVLNTLFNFWIGKGYHGMEDCAHVWLAGSGITYQWAAHRDPGDLDVLIGLDSRRFIMANPAFSGKSEGEIATTLNSEMRALLWPTTDRWNGLEVTFYINSRGQDIRSIHPYAAYDVTQNHWTVLPPALPVDYDADRAFPESYRKAVHTEHARAAEIIEQYESALSMWHSIGDIARQRNAAVQLQQAVEAGASLFTSIHSERHNAFSGTGQGYQDYFNYRWQTHKRSGVVGALHELASLRAAGRLLRNG